MYHLAYFRILGVIIFLSPLYSQATDFPSLLPFPQTNDGLLPAEMFTPDPEELNLSGDECIVEIDTNTDATQIFSQYRQSNCTFIITSPPEKAIPFSGNLDLTMARLVRIQPGKYPLPLDSELYQPLFQTETPDAIVHYSSPPAIVRFKPTQQHSGFINILFSPDNTDNLRIELNLTETREWHIPDLFYGQLPFEPMRSRFYFRPPALHLTTAPSTAGGDDPDKPYWFWNLMHQLFCQTKAIPKRSHSSVKYQRIDSEDESVSLSDSILGAKQNTIIRQQPTHRTPTACVDVSQPVTIGSCSCCTTVHIAITSPESAPRYQPLGTEPSVSGNCISDNDESDQLILSDIATMTSESTLQVSDTATIPYLEAINDQMLLEITNGYVPHTGEATQLDNSITSGEYISESNLNQQQADQASASVQSTVPSITSTAVENSNSEHPPDAGVSEWYVLETALNPSGPPATTENNQ